MSETPTTPRDFEAKAFLTGGVVVLMCACVHEVSVVCDSVIVTVRSALLSRIVIVPDPFPRRFRDGFCGHCLLILALLGVRSEGVGHLDLRKR